MFLHPGEVDNVMREIPEDDLALLRPSEEHARPDWMAFTVLPLQPFPVRPSISTDSGALRRKDDLTYKSGDIIKASATVFGCEEEEAPICVISEFEQLLQFHVATYMDKDIYTSSSTKNGDYVLFNRWPLLHKMSMQRPTNALFDLSSRHSCIQCRLRW
ncbi:hypothetical protein ACEPAG_2045 [Sanghuangporus baumii]